MYGPFPAVPGLLVDQVMPAVSLPLIHVERSACNCDRCSAARAARIRGEVLTSLTTRERATARLAARRSSIELGLSNPAYLAAAAAASGISPLGATPGSWEVPFDPERPQSLRLSLGAARLGVRWSDAVADHLTPGRGATGVQRGVIRELSEASRMRLADTAYSLTEQGFEPELMLTLTSPANYEQVYLYDPDGVVVNGGKLFKTHMDTFRKRLTRWLNARGINEFKALWFLEFQKRGAPHVHFMIFDSGITEKIRKQMINWIGGAWSDIVGNPDIKEKRKHRKSCSKVEKMRVKHFGYATKYATKTEQKTVPEEFKNVGRFWGMWNHKNPQPDVIIYDFSHLKLDEVEVIRKMMWSAVATIAGYSGEFAAKTIGKVEKTLREGVKYKYGFSIFGSAAVGAIKSAIGGV